MDIGWAVGQMTARGHGWNAYMAFRAKHGGAGRRGPLPTWDGLTPLQRNDWTRLGLLEHAIHLYRRIYPCPA